MKIAKLLCGVALGGLLASNAMAADLLYSSPAQAAVNYGGPYAGVKGGVNWLGSDPRFAGEAADVATPDILSFDAGFNAGIVGGYSFGQRWGMFSPRLEVELGYLRNNLSTFRDDSAVAATAGATGDVHAFYGLANILLDIPVGGFGFTPFVGAGIGFANTRLSVILPPVGGAGVGTDQFADDTNFAWDVTAGLSYDISRNVTFDIAYRFLQFTSVKSSNTGATGTDTPGFTSSSDIDNHQVTAGVRVHL
jgi:opacity protein-like surface antigen